MHPSFLISLMTAFLITTTATCGDKKQEPPDEPCLVAKIRSVKRIGPDRLEIAYKLQWVGKRRVYLRRAIVPIDSLFWDVDGKRLKGSRQLHLVSTAFALRRVKTWKWTVEFTIPGNAKHVALTFDGDVTTPKVTIPKAEPPPATKSAPQAGKP